MERSTPTLVAAARDGRPDTAHIGRQIHTERLKAGMTQSALADGQYTKAYISALEHGLIRPSMTALTFLAGRLGLSPADLITDVNPRWSRLEADLALARADYQAAALAYGDLLEATTDDRTRAELLLGLAESSSRIEESREAVRTASEAAQLFARQGRATDRLWALYWQANGLYQLENSDEARRLLAEIREADGSLADPDLQVRALIAAAMVESREERPELALSYLESARSRVAELDGRRRAVYLFSLALSYREIGDLEGAVRAGTQALAYFKIADAELESAQLENELALVYLALGNTDRAREQAGVAHDHTARLGDDRLMAHVVETEGQIALARGETDEAIARSDQARELAQTSEDSKALVSALLLAGRARRTSGDTAGATAALESAAKTARAHGRSRQLMAVLTELAEVAADSGDLRRAYELSREALASTSS